MSFFNKYKYLLTSILLNTIFIILLFEDIDETNTSVYNLACYEAKGSINKDIAYRRWASIHGGVYVPIDSNTPPNIYLTNVDERDIITPNGKKLTLMNPAYMTRQVHEIAEKQYGVKGHITSINPLRPSNIADDWEKKALSKFSKDTLEFSELSLINGDIFLRYMKAMVTENSCLKCHSFQGYKVGDIRGGVSVSLPWKQYQKIIDEENFHHYTIYSLIIFILNFLIIITYFVAKKNNFKIKISQLKLIQEKEKSDTYLKLVDVIILALDTNGIIQMINRCGYQVLEYELNDLEGKDWFITCIPEEDKSTIIAMYKKMCSGDILDCEYFENNIITKNGNKRLIAWHNCLIIDENNNITGTLSSGEDITLKKKIEIDLKNSEEKFAKAFKTIPEAISIASLKDAKYIEINDAFLNVTGFTRDEVIGHTSYELNVWLSNEDRNKFIEEITKNRSLRNYPLQFKMKNGEIRDFLVSSDLIMVDNELCGLNFIQDVTEQIKAQKLLMKQNTELEAQYEEYMQLNEVLRLTNHDLEISKLKAEESDKLKSAFLQNLSHEIRTPLNGIIGYSNLLQYKNLTFDEITEYTEMIQLSGDRLIEVLNNIIDISKIETGLFEINNSEFSLNTIFTDLYTQYSPLTTAKKLSLNFITELDDENSLIKADNSKIVQVLSHLINNSIKFTSSGFINYGYTIKKDQIEFYVKDSGIGIPESSKDRIFVKFAQVDLSIARGYEGAGLGLSICQGFVQLLGGTIWFESKYNEGSTFYFTIPFNPIKNLDKPIVVNTVEKVSKSKGKILIVEDDWASYQYLKTLLLFSEYNIIHADNGARAVEFVRNIPDISLILMDLKMPIMNGFEATKFIREFSPDVPIIAQTAYEIEQEKLSIFDIGCNEFITKPISKDKLLSLIKKYFK